MKGLARILNRALASVSMRVHVATANLWRDSYNPLRGLTITRAVCMLEEGERGAYAQIQWLYRYIEMQDATLGALVERRTSAVQEMGWDVKVPEGLEGAELALAEKQADALREAYNSIRNLKAAIEFLCMASFRGFSHLEVIRENGAITELAPVEQWFWCRNGLNGDWKYNADSKFGVIDGEEIGDRLFIVREVARPINRVALVSFIRKSMSQKDWDGFIETYGIPAVFIIAPPDIPKEKEDEYQEVAESIATDARGVLPGGSDVKTVDNGARGVNPFLDHIKHQDEQVILRGTGGKLTMLAESGSGTLAGNAHADAFDQIARAEAVEISEILQDVIDAAVMEEKFPGQKQLAYFEIAANEETDTKAVVSELAILSRAGYRVSADQVKERTGYDVSSVAGDGMENEELRMENAVKNRGLPAQENDFDEAARKLLDEARAADMQPLGDALAEILQDADPAVMRERLAELDERLPELLGETPAQDTAWNDILASALVNGMAGAQGEIVSVRNSGTSEGARKGWETRRKNGWKPKRQREELARFYDEAMGSDKELFLDYSEVSPDEAARILAKTGVDVAGYKRTLDSSAVKHILKEHGDAEKEAPRGQVAITKEDFASLADTLRNADAVEPGKKTAQGLETIRYYKDGDGTTYIVEEVRTGRGKLVPKTMRKHKQAGYREKEK